MKLNFFLWRSFRPSLSYHLSLRPLFFLFLSGHFTQVLLYLKHKQMREQMTKIRKTKGQETMDTIKYHTWFPSGLFIYYMMLYHFQIHHVIKNIFFPQKLHELKLDQRNIKSIIFIFEPVHEISNKMVCATSKASDQPAQSSSLIRAFASCLGILWL